MSSVKLPLEKAGKSSYRVAREIPSTPKTVDSNRSWIWVIGLGIALTPIHNAWFTNLLTNSKGETVFFLPAFATLLWLMGSLLFLVKRWRKGDRWEDWLGDRRIFIPLLIIVLFMGISGFLTGDGLGGKLAPLFMGLSLFSVYVAARKLGAGLFRALIPFTLLGVVIAVVMGLLNPGVPSAQTEGLITNYCAFAGFLVFGAVLNQGKWQWLLVAAALVGVFFIGALEGAFIVVVVGLTVLIRRDFSRKLWIIVGIGACVVALWATLGYLVPLYTGNGNIGAVSSLLSGNSVSADAITSSRWSVIIKSLKDMHFFGHGFTLTVGTTIDGIGNTVHNMPLVIVHQIGPIAGLAWLFVSLWCLVKTKWKYAWIALLAMGVFDHFLWTQFSPYFFAIIGVSTTSVIKSDLIFKKVGEK